MASNIALRIGTAPGDENDKRGMAMGCVGRRSGLSTTRLIGNVFASRERDSFLTLLVGLSSRFGGVWFGGSWD